MKVRTRFAPSPTGKVHIGNIRTAIFNWLFARHHGGEFLLRFEDTDLKRSTPEAIRYVQDVMEWMGLDVDEEPLYQSSRTADHLSVAEELLSKGLAYKEDKGGLGQGDCVVFKMPNHDMEFHDLVQGACSKPAGSLNDFVIVRSDGSPVFHLANVLDDIQQGVTHVIRGDDHKDNTFGHIALYRAIGADLPAFAHLPMIVNAEGKPYAKRDGDAFVGDFRGKGIGADALFNYLVLLGWSPGNNLELMSREEMVQKFDLSRCRRSPSQFDFVKLQHMNKYYAESGVKEIRAFFDAELMRAGIDCPEEYKNAAFSLLSDRIKAGDDFLAEYDFLFKEEYKMSPAALEFINTQALAKEGLMQLITELEELKLFDESALKSVFKEVGKQTGLKVYPLVRIAVSGIVDGPGLIPMLIVLGRDRILARIKGLVRQL